MQRIFISTALVLSCFKISAQVQIFEDSEPRFIQAIKFERMGNVERAKELYQNILINTISERDISRNEALLILCKEDYVEYSMSFRYVNLSGNRKVVSSVEKESDTATESNNWLEWYSKREENENYLFGYV